MASSQAEEQSHARVWSEAVFGLAASRGVEDSMLEEWRGLVELLDRDKDLKAVMASPLVNNEEKRQLIEKSFRGKASDLFVDTLQVLRSKGRLGLLRFVAGAFHGRSLFHGEGEDVGGLVLLAVIAIERVNRGVVDERDAELGAAEG